ncbi:hypothetical protein [Thioalbus denitrificans]|uniref:Uncharacterized protein n=1 Tax=Thioalbus denitrificans TaxID=547122 RepID=A0A369C2H6_9GAMM|nr:hypothetical protein [Thioalbus denitrificans]RCX28099.1 hypothetical protein DFQ59_108127 [Thioalbus denitrificans]
MTAASPTPSALPTRFLRVLCCGLLLASASVATAAEGDSPDAGQTAAPAEQQRIDRETGAFESPLLIRMRARVSPNWPGPRGTPPATERRHCPVIPGPAGTPGTVPDFC